MTRKLGGSHSGELQYIPLDETSEYFQSHDIGLVGFLLCQSFELLSLDKALKNKVLFILKRSNGLDEAINNYWSFNSSVDAQTYFNQIKRLKNQIYSSD
ncbi:MAG: DUF5659 domain-containing protein [Patescibacteria group bacterium]